MAIYGKIYFLKGKFFMLKPTSSTSENESPDIPPAKMNVFLLLIGIAIMLVGSIFPWIFADGNGKAHHGIAMLLFWAMSAGIVRGVGFIPHHIIPKVLFSGWAVLIGILGAVILRFIHQ